MPLKIQKLKVDGPLTISYFAVLGSKQLELKPATSPSYKINLFLVRNERTTVFLPHSVISFSFQFQIWFQNRRAKYRKQRHKIVIPSEPDSVSSDLSTSSPDSSKPIGQKSDDLLRGDSRVPCTLPCCLPRTSHVNGDANCNCFSCLGERIRIFHDSIQHRMYGMQNVESLQKYVPLLDMEQFYAEMTVCCCSACRLGTFYVQY